ncbi:hypothetical protein FACS1894105_04100 [Clostridia bacterium]|nr:hypothetical protein FACS1894105_04100 [Clostridia bacterium]
MSQIKTKFSKRILSLLAVLAISATAAFGASAATSSITPANVLGGTLTGSVTGNRTSSTTVSVSAYAGFTGSGTRVVGLDATDYITGTADVAYLPTTRSNSSGNATINGTITTPSGSSITLFSSHEIRQTSSAAVRYTSLANV